MFLDCEQWEDGVLLWAVANQLAGFFEVFLDVEAGNCDIALGRQNVTCQTLERCRLASTINTQECEAFTKLEPK